MYICVYCYLGWGDGGVFDAFSLIHISPPHHLNTHKPPSSTLPTPITTQHPHTHHSISTTKLLLALANNALETHTLDLKEKTYARLSTLDGPGHR